MLQVFELVRLTTSYLCPGTLGISQAMSVFWRVKSQCISASLVLRTTSATTPVLLWSCQVCSLCSLQPHVIEHNERHDSCLSESISVKSSSFFRFFVLSTTSATTPVFFWS